MPSTSCYAETYTVRLIDVDGFDAEDTTPELTPVDRSSTLAITAIAPAGETYVQNSVVVLVKLAGVWWILRQYCHGVTYAPGTCHPLDCLAEYVPQDNSVCEQAPEFGYFFELGNRGADCCDGEANGRVCLTNDDSGDIWRSVIYETSGCQWELDIQAGTLTLYDTDAPYTPTIVQYQLIADAWCCLCPNEMRLACPTSDACADDWPETVCVRPLEEFCEGGDECDYTLYDWTVVVSGFSGGTGGCCDDFNGTWVMSHQSGLIFTSPSSAACSDSFQRNWSLTQLFNGTWQLQGTVIGTSDVIIYLADDLSCSGSTVFTEFSNDTGCTVPGAPSTLTVTPSLAA